MNGYWKVTYKNNSGITSTRTAFVYAASEDEAMKEGLALFRKDIESNYGLDFSSAEDRIEKVELIEELL